MSKKNAQQLALLEASLKELGYAVRYEKGNFLGGDCRLREERVVVVNRFLPVEGKTYTLASVLSRINPPGLNPEVAKIIDKIAQNTLFSR